MTQDLTRGNPTKLILLFTIPILIGNIFQQLYSLADTIIVGRAIDVSALAAVGATGSLTFLVLGFVQGVACGFSVITAQRFGANDLDGVRRSVATSITLSIAITVIITILSIATARPLLTFMRTPEDIIDQAVLYIIIIYLGIAATIFYNLISSIIRALGDSISPLLFLIIASVINIVLDFVLILWIPLGVAGAALATIISQAIAGFLSLLYVKKKIPILHLEKSDFQFDWHFAWEHLRVGLPMAFQFSITAIGVMVVQTVLNSFGSVTVAAYTAACRIDQLVTQPFVAFGTTIATYAAQNYGANQIKRIQTGARSCIILSVSAAILGGIVSIFLGKYLVELFVGKDQPQVMADARTYLTTVAIFYVVLALLFIYRNTLQGIGKAFIPVFAGVCEVIMRVLVSVFLAAPLGYRAVCLTDPIAWIGATIPLAIAYLYHMHKLMKQERHQKT